VKALSFIGPVDLNGKLLPWAGRPIIVTIEGRRMLPIFSTEEKLHTAMSETRITGYSIKVIDDGVDFMASMDEQGMPVCLDPYRHEGRMRFKLCVSQEPHDETP